VRLAAGQRRLSGTKAVRMALAITDRSVLDAAREPLGTWNYFGVRFSLRKSFGRLRGWLPDTVQDGACLHRRDRLAGRSIQATRKRTAWWS
jgi:hypothetical protein